MVDNKRQQDNAQDEDMGQMGDQSSYSGQKGGQAQSDFNSDTSNTGRSNDPTSDSSLSDEDL